MTKDNKFKIGLALNAVACMVCDEDYQKIKGKLKEIEDIVVNEPSEEDKRE